MKQRAASLKVCLFLSIFLVCLVFALPLGTVHAAARTKLLVGESRQLPGRNCTDWRSNKPSVVSVNSSGRIKALRRGSGRITAIRNGKRVTFKVSVAAPFLNASKKSISVSQRFPLTLKKGSGFRFSWSVSDPTILKLKKKGKNKYRVFGLRNGTADVIVSSGSFRTVCSVVVGTGITDEQAAAQKKAQEQAAAQKKAQEQAAAASSTQPAQNLQTLYLDGNVFKEMTWKRSDVAQYVSSFSRYGQSAPLYIHKDGGDGLENIWAYANNGAVGVANTQLSADAVRATIAKACVWARAVADSPYHGYDYGHSYTDAATMYTFGQAKPTGLGTGDYCCSSLPLCAYYFAGVNVIGENLGGSNAKYIPHTTKLFYESVISFYNNGKLESCSYKSNYEWRILSVCGFTDVVDSYNLNPGSFQFEAGDIITANGHSQLVLTAGTKSNAETVQAYGPDKVPNNGMPKGGDQSGSEIARAGRVRVTSSQPIKHIMRFTGKGVRLNTAGLVS